MLVNRIAQRAWLRMRYRGLMAELEALRLSEQLDAEGIALLQKERLRALLEHAAARVPYYRKVFAEAAADPSAGPAGLAALPVLTKEIIRERGAELISDDAGGRGAFRNATGGSTGTPLVFTQDALHWIRNQAAIYRGFLWTDWSLGDPLAYLWGSDVDARHHRGRGALRDALLGITWVDAFSLTDPAMDRLLRVLGRRPDTLLIGYATSLAALARRAVATGVRPRIRAVQSSAEMLAPEDRRRSEEAFGCRVFDRYGCREAGVVAQQCGQGGGWHVNAENVVVETDGSGGVLLTTLNNFSMPLIRYANEDLAVLGEGSCACGRSLPLIARVEGRRSDIIVSPSGKAIHGEFFTHLFYGVGGVREFQVRQVRGAELTIAIVADGAFAEEARARIERDILEHGDPAFRVTWERVEAIPRTRSGKRRFVIAAPGGEGSGG